jgi:hypothetical protein
VIVIAKQVGRLANRLVLFAHFIATAAEHDLQVADPALENYARYFPATSRTLVPRWPAGRAALPWPRPSRNVSYAIARVTGEALWQAQRRGPDVPLIRLQRGDELDLGSTEFLEAARGHRALFVLGWRFRNHDGVRRHAALLRDYFTPHPRPLERAAAAVRPAQDRGRLVAGIHIRRGDYATFDDGSRFFDHSDYRRVMLEVQAAHPGRDVAFLVCSDEPVPHDAFAGLELLRAPGTELEDLYALASCDLIVGPVSTYNRWASFWGEVPLFTLTEASTPFEPKGAEVAYDLAPRQLARP